MDDATATVAGHEHGWANAAATASASSSLPATTDEHGWADAVPSFPDGQQPQPQRHVPKRGRPRKVTLPQVPAASAPEADEGLQLQPMGPRGLESVLQGLVAGAHAVLGAIGSLFQKRLWDVVCRPTSANAASSSIADCLFKEAAPILRIASQEKLQDEGSRQTLARDEKRLACCGLHFSGQLTGLLLRKCSRLGSDWKTAAVIKRRKYDETPTKIGLKETIEERQHLKTLQKTTAAATVEVAKIFQSELSVGILLWNAKLQARSLVKVTLPMILHCVDSATAENIKRIQCEVESFVASLDTLELEADHVFSVPCTDRASANVKAEKDLTAAGAAGTVNRHFVCRIHKASQIQTKQFSLVENHVSGLLHCALSMRGGGVRKTLQRMLFDVIRERLVIRLGQPEHLCRSGNINE